MSADFLDQKRNEISARIRELRPLVAEYERLEAAARALDGISPARAGNVAPSSGRRGRPKGSGKRGA